MIPGGRASTIAHRGDLYNPWSRDPIVSWHWGPVAIQDPSQGLGVKLWTMTTDDSGKLFLSADGVPQFQWYDHGTKVERLGLAFDQNGRPVAVWTDALSKSYLRWFDPVPNAIVTVEITSYGTTPCVTLDDNRPLNLTASDVILGYINSGQIRYRQQRERFLTEHTLPVGDGGPPATANQLYHVSMNSNLRLEFITDGAGDDDWTLADIVTELMALSDVESKYLNVRQLQNIIVSGYRIANEGGADVQIGPLQATYFFDPGEWDKKIHFVLRGRDPVARLTFDDLLEVNSPEGPLQIERVQEIELLRKVNVTMIDETAGWIPTKQSHERRTATIKAVGESSVVIPVTGDPDLIATVAAKRLRVPWAEPNKFRYNVGVPWAELTVTDIIELEDRRGRVHRMRLGVSEEDYGSFSLEASTDGYWVYSMTAKGKAAPPNIPTVPGQAGDTVVVPIDMPVIRDQDDLLGYYVAAAGTGDAWRDAVIQISLDAGATIAQSIYVDAEATMGATLTNLLPEVSAEYLSSQTLRVTLPVAPESVTREDVLRYRNMMALQHDDGTWELLNYQTVTPVDATTFDLSGLLRARYATSPLAATAGARIVLITDAVAFVQIQEWMLGHTISYRGVTTGQNPDDVPWLGFSANAPKSQTEWPVTYAKATIDPSGNTSVSWIGRGRIGTETAPRNSQYFTGYRLTYSDGVVVDTTDTVHYRTGVSPTLTDVQIQAVNSFTGVGPVVTVPVVTVPSVTVPGTVINGGEVAP